MGIHQTKPAIDIAAFKARWKLITSIKPTWKHEHTPELKRRWDQACGSGSHEPND